MKKIALILFIAFIIFGPNIARAQFVVSDPGNQVVNTKSSIENTLQSIFDSKQWTKEILEKALKRVGTKVLYNTTKKTVNWALTGFKSKDSSGLPFYVQNQDSLIKNIDEQQIASIVDSLTQCPTIKKTAADKSVVEEVVTSSCPYARSIAKTLITGYKNEKSGQTQNKYTLNKILGGEAAEFKTDFSKGGWAAWDAFTQNPYNNPVGAFLETSITLSEKREEEKVKLTEELARNDGFLSLKKCVAYKDGKAPTSEIDFSKVKTLGKKTTYDKSVYKYELKIGTLSGLTYCKAQPPFNNISPSELVGDKAQWKKDNCKDLTELAVTKTVGGQAVDYFENTYALPGLTVDNCERYETITPGNIVKEQLTKSLNTTIDDQLLSKNSGNSILDTVADMTANLISRGLDKLVTNVVSSNKSSSSQGYFAASINLPQNTIFLGSTSSPNSSAWYSGLSAQKIQDPGNPKKLSPELLIGIENLKKEIAILKQTEELIDNTPGYLQELDQCLPGPDLGWEERLSTEFKNSSRKLDRKAAKDSGKADEAEEALTKLEIYKEKVVEDTKKALRNLDGQNITSAPLIINRISLGANQGYKRITIEKSISKNTALTTLELIQEELAANPNPNIEELSKEYQKIASNISTEESILDSQTELDALKNDYRYSFDRTNPSSLLARCIKERKTKPDLVGRDQGLSLYCPWEIIKQMGSTVPGRFDDPITARYGGGGLTVVDPVTGVFPLAGLFGGFTNGTGYTQNQKPFNSDEFKVDCHRYYQASISVYSN